MSREDEENYGLSTVSERVTDLASSIVDLILSRTTELAEARAAGKVAFIFLEEMARIREDALNSEWLAEFRARR